MTMIKPLLITSLCAFLAAAGFFSLAAASGVAHGGNPWNSFGFRGDRIEGEGPHTTRTIPWPGGDTLEVNIGADVRYVQGPNTGLTVTGRKSTVENVIVSNGELRFDKSMRNRGDLAVVLTAPDVRKFRLRGSNSLIVDNYDQDTLEVSVAGSGEADLNGKARSLEISIAGSGDVDAENLILADAKVSIAGSGEAKVGPSQSADIHIAGSGDVELTSRPTKLNSNVSGSGSVTTR
jgi:hypothetical protein